MKSIVVAAIAVAAVVAAAAVVVVVVVVVATAVVVVVVASAAAFEVMSAMNLQAALVLSKRTYRRRTNGFAGTCDVIGCEHAFNKMGRGAHLGDFRAFRCCCCCYCLLLLSCCVRFSNINQQTYQSESDTRKDPQRPVGAAHAVKEITVGVGRSCGGCVGSGRGGGGRGRFHAPPVSTQQRGSLVASSSSSFILLPSSPFPSPSPSPPHQTHGRAAIALLVLLSTSICYFRLILVLVYLLLLLYRSLCVLSCGDNADRHDL